MFGKVLFGRCGFVLTSVLAASVTPQFLCAGPVSDYGQHNLVSDVLGLADNLDPNLANPWGIAFSPTGPFWVADNHTGVSTVYNGAGQPLPPGSPLVVSIPNTPSGSPPGSPTGIVFNATSGFKVGGQKSLFIFAAEEGTISAWNSGVNASLKVDNSASGAVYKGLALGGTAAGPMLYAANFNSGMIDVFDQTFAPVSLGAGAFTDPGMMDPNFAPFNVQNIGGQLYVTYAKQNGAKHDDVAGPGNGYVDVFDMSGTFVKRLVTKGVLNSPWGLALAPASFGAFGNDLLIGNFGDGIINAFDPAAGTFLGRIEDGMGNPLVNQGLWGITFGNGGLAGDPGKLYFAAGIPGGGHLEDHGLFGSIQPVPEPGTLTLLGLGLLGVAACQRRGRLL